MPKNFKQEADYGHKKIDISLACFGKTKGKKTKKLAELRV